MRRQLHDMFQRWAGAESSGRRRAVAAMALMAVGLLAWIAFIEWVNNGGFGLLFLVLVMVGVGIFARTWLALLTSYVAAVLLFWVAEVGTYLWVGADEWAERNAEHWQGDEPAIEKLIGQLIEYAVIGLVFIVPLVALGVAVGHWIEENHGDWRHRQSERSGA